MLPKNDLEYVKNVILAALAIFAGAFAVSFVIYWLLNDNILLAFIMAAVASFLVFMKDMARKLLEALKSATRKILSFFSR